jgi:hypothetical protein
MHDTKGKNFMARTGLEKARDDELVEIASQSEGGGGAVVESMTRLRKAVESASGSADRYSSRMLFLTLVLVITTIVLLVPAIKEVWNWSR